MIKVKVVPDGKSVRVISQTRTVKPRVSLGGNFVPLATSLKAGKIRLAGDLGGTAEAPTVPGLAGKEPALPSGTLDDYLSGNKTWLPVTGLPLSTAAQDALDDNWEATKQYVLNSYHRISLYNVLDGVIIDEVPYFAMADGVTDNTVAVQKIFDYVSGIGGGRIFFPAGDYMFRNSVWIRDGLEIDGVPNASTLTSDVDPAIQAVIGIAADQRMYGIFRSDQVTPIYKGWTCRNLDFLGNVTEEPSVPQANRTRNPSPFHAIKINGSACPATSDDFGQPTSGPYITNIVIENITVRHMASLPITIFGVSGRNIVNGSLFRNCKDVGYVYNEEVICTNNHSIGSSDNGFSLSRGNRKVVCNNNTVENAALFGIWLSGYNSDIGPSQFVCNGNVVRNCGRSCLNFDYGPSNGTVVGNYLYQGYHRGPWDAPSDTGIDGMTIAGASGGVHATGLLISSNIIDSPARNGIAFKELDNSLIENNLIINPGTPFKANGTTPINAGDTTSNNGICPIATGSYSDVRIKGNLMLEKRTTPYGNYPVSSAGTGGTYVRNNDFNGNWRNSNSTLTISDMVMDGSNIVYQYSSPSGVADVWHNMAGSSKQFIRSADGSNFVLNSTSTSNLAKATMLFSAGSDPTSYIGAITVGRQGDLASSIMSFRPFRNSLLASDGKSAPLWLAGKPTNSRGVIGLMGGQVHQATTLSDISYTATAIDFLIALTSMSTMRTITLPDATTLDAGQVFEVADWSGQAGIYGIKISPASATPAQTIDGATYALISNGYGKMKFYTDGTNWHTHNPNAPANVIAPIDYGFLAQNMVLPSITGTGQLATSGKVYVMKMRADKAMTISNIHIFITTQGTSLTSGQNFAALYSSSKALLAQTSDQTTAWGSVGMKTMALSSAQTIPPGYFYVAMWSNGTTTPTIRAGASGSSSVNGILSTANSLFATADSSITTTAPATLATFAADTTAKWAAVS